MKIFTAQQIKQADENTLISQQITSLELMERAADKAFLALLKKYKNTSVSFKIFCGVGNNGGDGLVIARKLMEKEFDVQVFIVKYSSHFSSDFQENLKRLEKVENSTITFLEENSDFPELGTDVILIDSIFGIGLNRMLPKWIQDLIDNLNHSKLPIISIDIPTGMLANLPKINQSIIRASETLTFQHPKFSFFLPETAEYTGKVKVLDIDLDTTSLKSDIKLIKRKSIRKIYKSRKLFSHKGTFGHVLLAGGSKGMMGSMILSSKAALRAGAGKATALIPKSGNDILQIAVPELMTIRSEGKTKLSDFKKLSFTPEVICFGMGAGKDPKTVEFFEELIKSAKNPIVIDADGLNILSENKNLLKNIPANSVLTPHPKELQRLIGPWKNDFEKIEKTQNLALQHQLIILIKGYFTLVISGKKIFINPSGNPGMATAGSGDVLSGIIAGLMAQNYSPEHAAVMGVWIHGKAGDLAAKKNSQEAMVAGDISEFIGKVFLQLKN